MSGVLRIKLKGILIDSIKSNYAQRLRYSTNPQDYRIGFIGCGNMGSRMSANLVKKGHRVLVFDNDRKITEKLKNDNFEVAESLDQLADFGNCFITMLPDGKAVLGLYGGKEGIASKLKRGSLIIDCSTVDPRDAIELRPILDKVDCRYVDAPVSGGVNAAAKGSLTFMVGGETEAFEDAVPILSDMGSNVIHCGKQGNGQVAKVCNNMLLAISMIGLSESLDLGKKMGLDPSLLLKIINTSSGRCWSSEVYSPAPNTMEGVPSSNSYIPGFQSRIMLKDLRIAKDSSESCNSETALGKEACRIYEHLCQTSMGDLDFSVIYKYLESSQKST